MEKLLPTISVRLYRIGLLPKDHKLAGMTPASPGFADLDWLDQAVVEAGHNLAFGRWFAKERHQVDWYARENHGRPLYYVDIPQEQASSWLVANNAEARRYSLDPEKEYFIPADIANRPLVMPGYVAPRFGDIPSNTPCIKEPFMPQLS